MVLNGRFPTCHPEILTDPKSFDETLESYFGLAQVKILPPTDLALPILPYRARKKLLFSLCRTCAEKESQSPCECTIEQRAMTGTWTTVELLAAMKRQYRILKIYEIYNYPESTKYSGPGSDENGLFGEYVNKFLVIKQQASGFPEGVESQFQKEAYVQDYEHKQGVKLDIDKIEKNPGLRLIAKLYLNRCVCTCVKRDIAIVKSKQKIIIIRNLKKKRY